MTHHLAHGRIQIARELDMNISSAGEPGEARVSSRSALRLLTADSSDACILDPADHLAIRIPTLGIAGAAFVFTDVESGRVTTIPGPDAGDCGSHRRDFQ